MVSSTSTCKDDYVAAISEISALITLNGDNVIPCLWLTEQGLSDIVLDLLLSSGIKWECLKIHPALRRDEWSPQGKTVGRLFSLAEKLGQVPVLIHTGEDDTCCAMKYERIIAENQDIPIILAHGRPQLQARFMTSKYNNVYIDTAFMEVSEIVNFVEEGLAEKILWGTDFCIPQVFDPGINLQKYYKSKLKSLSRKIDAKSFSAITSGNAMKVFSAHFR